MILFSSAFPQAAGTTLPAIDPAWINTSEGTAGDLKVDSTGRLYGASGADRAVYNATTAADQAAEADFQIAAVAGTSSLVFRCANPAVPTYYRLTYNTGLIRWVRMVSGTATVLGSGYSVPDTVAASRKIRGEVEGNQLRLYVDGTLRETVTDAVIASGLMGVHCNASKVRLDNLLLETLDNMPLPVAFSGTVPAQSVVEGTAFSLDLASYFSGTGTPFSYGLQAGSLSGTGLALAGAVISGTPTTVGTITGLVVRATDTGSGTADTSAFNIVVTASGSGPTGSFTSSRCRNAAGALLSGVAVDYALHVGAGLADFASLDTFPAQKGAATLDGDGRLSRSGHTLGAGLLLMRTPSNHVFVEPVTVA